MGWESEMEVFSDFWKEENNVDSPLTVTLSLKNMVEEWLAKIGDRTLLP